LHKRLQNLSIYPVLLLQEKQDIQNLKQSYYAQMRDWGRMCIGDYNEDDGWIL